MTGDGSVFGKVVASLFGALAVILSIVRWPDDLSIGSLAIALGAVVVLGVGIALLLRGLAVRQSSAYVVVVIAGLIGTTVIGTSSVPLAFILPPLAVLVPTLLFGVRIGPSRGETAFSAFALSTVGITLAARPGLDEWKFAPAVMALLLQRVLLLVVLVYRRAAFPPGGAVPEPHTVTPGLAVIGSAAVFAFFYSTISFMAHDETLFSRTRAGADAWRWWPLTLACLLIGAGVVFRGRHRVAVRRSTVIAVLLSVGWVTFLALTFTPSPGANSAYVVVSLAAAPEPVNLSETRS